MPVPDRVAGAPYGISTQKLFHAFFHSPPDDFVSPLGACWSNPSPAQCFGNSSTFHSYLDWNLDSKFSPKVHLISCFLFPAQASACPFPRAYPAGTLPGAFTNSASETLGSTESLRYQGPAHQHHTPSPVNNQQYSTTNPANS